MRHVPILVLVSVLGLLASRASAFTVNASLDKVDVNIGDGLCRNEDQLCSLRAAIQEANALGGPRTITLQSLGPYLLRLQEPDPDDPDEDASATGDLDVSTTLVIEPPVGTTRRIQVAFNEFEGPRADRIFHVLPAGDLTLRGISLEDGVATSASTSRGGAILNEGTLDLSDCMLDGNEALEGGAIYNDGFLDVDECTFSNNQALDTGGGAGEGGAITSTAFGITTILRSTFTANRADVRGGAIFGGFDTVVDLENSTLSGNAGPDVLRFENINQSFLSHVTIHANTGTGIVTNLFDTINAVILSSIVSGSSVANCSFSGTVTPSTLTNLSSDASCDFAQTGGYDSTDPELGPLMDNGGSTLTHLPAVTSLAVDNAFEDLCPGEDQRGILRPNGHGMLGFDQCDVGAVELVPEPSRLLLGLAALLAVATRARRYA